MMWWSVLLGGKVHSHVVVLAPVTGSEVAMDELHVQSQLELYYACLAL